jgi:hypothetical protein
MPLRMRSGHCQRLAGSVPGAMLQRWECQALPLCAGIISYLLLFVIKTYNARLLWTALNFSNHVIEAADCNCVTVQLTILKGNLIKNYIGTLHFFIYVKNKKRPSKIINLCSTLLGCIETIAMQCAI